MGNIFISFFWNENGMYAFISITFLDLNERLFLKEDLNGMEIKRFCFISNFNLDGNSNSKQNSHAIAKAFHQKVRQTFLINIW